MKKTKVVRVLVMFALFVGISLSMTSCYYRSYSYPRYHHYERHHHGGYYGGNYGRHDRW